jgi:hypothetical protein
MTVQKTSPFEIPDPRGKFILHQENIASASEISITKYVNMLKKYPLDFITMYAIRLFNGLDIKFPQVYVNESLTSRALFSLINYILLFFGLSNIINYYRNSGNKLNYILILCSMTFPGLVMVTSFVETRYFLQIQMILVYCGSLSLFRKTNLQVYNILKLIIFLICCFTLSASVYNQSLSLII